VVAAELVQKSILVTYSLLTLHALMCLSSYAKKQSNPPLFVGNKLLVKV
jgi:hypothetical protein